jgi:hypothetical protein
VPIRSLQAKRALLAQLTRSRHKGDELELELIVQGRDAEAAEVRRSTNRLSRRIDDLLAAMMRDWLGQASALQDDMRRRNNRLQACLRDIRKKLDIAKNVVKATGILDEAAKLAAQAFAP